MDDKKNNIEEPFRVFRNVGRCYSRGISMVSDNFRSFFRFLFPVTLVCALLSTLVNVAQLFPYEISLGFLEPYKDWFSVLFLLLNIVVYCAFLSHVYTLIKMKASDHNLAAVTTKFFYSESRKNFRRLFAWYCLLIPILCITFVLAPIAYLFLMLVLPCLMLSGKSFWRAVQSGIRLSCRFFFRNLRMLVFLLFSVVLACLLINSPLVVFYLLEYSAEASILSGDTIVLPDIYYYIAPAVMFVTTFLSLFVSIAFHTPIAYLYISAQISYEEELANIGKN